MINKKIFRSFQIGNYKISTELSKVSSIKKINNLNLKFDYIICGLPRSGSKAIQEILTSHDDLYIFSRNNLDEALSKGGKGLLRFHKSSQNILKYAKDNNIKTVLIVHHWHQLLSNEILATIKDIINQPILVIRDPIEAYISSYNNAWYYSFKKSAYFFGSWNLTDVKSITPIENILNIRNQHLNIMKQHMYGLDYVKFHAILCNKLEKKIPIMDFSILKSKKGISNLFKILDVKDIFHDYFLEPQQDRLWRYGHRNPIQMNYIDHIPIQLRYVFKEHLNESTEEPRTIPLESFQWTEGRIFNLRVPKKYYLSILENDFFSMNAEQKSFLKTSVNWTEFNQKEIPSFLFKMSLIEKYMNKSFLIDELDLNALEVSDRKVLKTSKKFYEKIDIFNNSN